MCRWGGIHARILAASLLVAVSLTAVQTREALAQDRSDSVALERLIENTRPELPFAGSARVLLLRRLTAGEIDGARQVVEFMDHRRGERTPWLSTSERLYTSTLIADPTFLRDAPLLESSLVAIAPGAEGNFVFDDDLAAHEIDLLRGTRDQVTLRLDQHAPSEIERRFFNLLLNHVTVRGYRAHAKLNARVDDFERQFPNTPYARLAGIYIRQEYSEAQFGGAFSAGYATGFFSGDLGDLFSSYSGPALAGELYIDRLTISGNLLVGGASSPQEFTAAGQSWHAGSASFLGMSLAGGYEFRSGLFAVTPLLGLSVQSVRAPDEGGETANLPRTSGRIGWDFGVIAGYRIPFDIGPSLDLRVRLGRSAALLADYDPRFSGALYYAQFSFAIVQRPFRGR